MELERCNDQVCSCPNFSRFVFYGYLVGYSATTAVANTTETGQYINSLQMYRVLHTKPSLFSTSFAVVLVDVSIKYSISETRLINAVLESERNKFSIFLSFPIVRCNAKIDFYQIPVQVEIFLLKSK